MKNLLFSNIEHFRYERKFYVEGADGKELEALLKFHPAIFREIYYKRTVNNIYFDSINLVHYFDNINGLDRRLKVRIRWYGNLFGFIDNPQLELKIKHNQHVGKLIYPLRSFKCDNNLSFDVIRKLFQESSLSQSLRLYLMELNTTLLNSYKRKYFISSNGKYRITIDTDLEVYRLARYQNSFFEKSTDYGNTILELKYNKPHDEFVDLITNYFSFRLSKSSKYVYGVNKLQGLF